MQQDRTTATEHPMAAASVFTALTGADVLQLAYAKAQSWAT